MKVLALMGSPRKGGNTALLLERYLDGLKQTNKDADINKVCLNDMDIHGCNACDACENIQRGQCVIRDDMQKLYPLFMEADMVIYATPVYWWSVTAQMKAFMDRCYALGKVKGSFEGKKAALLMTYGGELPNKGPELVRETFEEICEYKEMNLLHVYGVCTDDYMPVDKNIEALRAVYELGASVVLA